MTGADVKSIREALGRALGHRVSCRDLGLALGLAPANAKDTVRSWEDGSRDVSGPAAVALSFMRDGADAPDAGAHVPDDNFARWYYCEGVKAKTRQLFKLPEPAVR